jgi:hypothetical protein
MWYTRVPVEVVATQAHKVFVHRVEKDALGGQLDTALSNGTHAHVQLLERAEPPSHHVRLAVTVPYCHVVHL